ncbi:S-layer homology domain-containing protein [Bacillus sp. Marseille-P3661]|uniref:S-layer homology domain-containing protein n=1 Tax=Bacillus sp. Marseille-P3661 TaxID=1936234 RepID=UPI000C84A310|nr:glycosyl hydrolase family 18 protein [Bacillus sp. Marseille-P3661]
MIERYRLVKDGDGYTVILFIEPNSTEFANELGIKDTFGKRQDEKIRAFVNRNFKNIKVKSVKVMLGATLLTTISMNINTQTASAHQVNFNMSYLYFGSTDSFIKQVERTQGNLNVTSPSYFDINSDGSLKLSSDLKDPKFVNEMHKQGIKVVPFLSNHWDRNLGREALENREHLAQQIADAIETYDLDGVNVDIENVTDADRENYTDLVRLLREKIPEDKEVSVAVAANPQGWKKGWHGSYDYKALSQHADYLMIMAYDESFQGGEEGPVASYDWVEKSIQYAINQEVPPEKIVLGLAFFGRYWIEGQSYGGYGISNYRVEELVKKYNGKVTYDEKAKSPKAIVTIGPSDPVTTIAGKALKPGTYHIWFENNESITRKIDLVHKYNLKGTGSWSLGQEDTSLWYNFDMLVKNHDYQLVAPAPIPETQKDQTSGISSPTSKFRDINKHWAENDIISISGKGWMNGIESNVFAPDKTLTRAEAAAILVRALNLKAKQPIDPTTSTFADVNKGHWANHDIEIANQHGLMKGKAKGRFAPDEAVTREEMAVILDRILEESPAMVTEVKDFKDVESGRWSQLAIKKMNQHGIFKGFEDQTFKPTEKITRAQMASVLNRIAPQIEKDTKGILKVSVYGEEVKSLQSDLAFLGYFDEKITGYFGQATYDAVIAFQKDHDLSVDGIVGPQTLSKIKEEISKKS